MYAGPVSIDKPLTIDGGGQVTIDAGDKGTVMSLNASNSVLRGLRLTGSGESHDTDDSCLDVRGHHNTVEDLVLDNYVRHRSETGQFHSIVRNNRVSSKPFELGVRGDDLRLWYSNDNLIEGSRNRRFAHDMVAWYSHRNKFVDNLGRRSAPLHLLHVCQRQ